MRVTSQMIFTQTISNLGKSLNRYMRVQSMMSTGRTINTPSDDPIGTHHDLDYRNTLNQITQYQSNISQGTGVLGTYENGLGDLKNLYSSAKEISIMMANDTYDEAARSAAANEVESIFQQVMQLANSDNNGRFLYSGHLTHTKPMEASSNGIVYNGDSGIIEMEIDSGSRVTGNLIGKNVFLKQLNVLGGNSDWKVGLTGTTPLADLNAGSGVQLAPGTFQILDQNRNVAYTIDVSTATTIADVVTQINTQLGATANLSVKVADAGAALEWVPTIGTTNTVTASTALANLNGGVGVDLTTGKIRIRNDDYSTSFDVDLSSARTIGDVMTSVDTALAAHGLTGTVTIGLNPDGNGLMLTDTTGTLGLTVEEVSNTSQTAANLGITGRIDPTLTGSDLRPRPSFVISDIAAQTTAADLGLTGTIDHDTIGAEKRPRLTVNTTLTSLNNKVGFSLGKIQISQGNQTTTIDLSRAAMTTIGDVIAAINGSGLDIRATINAAETGLQITSTVDNKSLMITNADSTNTARMLGIEGSPDMLGSLMLLTNALRNNDRDLAESLNGNLEQAIQDLLKNRATIGARMSTLDTTRKRLDASKTNVTKLLSDVEDADIITVASKLGQEQNLYQAALVASSKLMMPTLLDFLK
jgi:flagellar hook-associated protein 3